MDELEHVKATIFSDIRNQTFHPLKSEHFLKPGCTIRHHMSYKDATMSANIDVELYLSKKRQSVLTRYYQHIKKCSSIAEESIINKNSSKIMLFSTLENTFNALQDLPDNDYFIPEYIYDVRHVDTTIEQNCYLKDFALVVSCDQGSTISFRTTNGKTSLNISYDLSREDDMKLFRETLNNLVNFAMELSSTTVKNPMFVKPCTMMKIIGCFVPCDDLVDIVGSYLVLNKFAFTDDSVL